MGQYLSTHRLRHGEQKALAERLGRSPRTLREWKRRAGVTGLPGRPPHSQEDVERAMVETARVLDTLVSGHNGEGTVDETLKRAGIVVPLRLVRRSLHDLKATQSAMARERLEHERMHVEVLMTNAVWTLDQTQLCRDEAGTVQGVALRDCLSNRVILASVGCAAKGADVVRLLELAAQDRGSWPLVLQMDNGPENNNVEVRECLMKNQVVPQWNLPHTPQHNPRSERGHSDWKMALGVASRDRRADRARARGGAISRPRARAVPRRSLIERLVHVWSTLDNATPRAGLLGMTTAELDRIAPRAEDHVRRARFYKDVCEELQRIALAPECARARRMHAREAIWAALERHGLVTRTRGGRPIPTVKGEGVS